LFFCFVVVVVLFDFATVVAAVAAAVAHYKVVLLIRFHEFDLRILLANQSLFGFLMGILTRTLHRY